MKELVTSSLTGQTPDRQSVLSRLGSLDPAERSALTRTAYAAVAAARAIAEVLGVEIPGADVYVLETAAAQVNGDQEMRRALVALGEMLTMLGLVITIRSREGDRRALSAIQEQVLLMDASEMQRVEQVGHLVARALGIIALALEDPDGYDNG